MPKYNREIPIAADEAKQLFRHAQGDAVITNAALAFMLLDVLEDVRDNLERLTNEVARANTFR